MENQERYKSYHTRRRAYTEEQERKPRKTIASIIGDRMYRYLTIPLFLVSMFFMLIPSLLVVVEMLGSVSFIPHLIFLACLFGILLVIFLLGRALYFQYRDLWFESFFVVLFALFMGSMSIGSIWYDNAISIGELSHRYGIRFNAIVQMFVEEYQAPITEDPQISEFSEADALMQSMEDDSLVTEYTRYGTSQYYNDVRADDMHDEVFKVMSLYRVMLEEFTILAPDPYTYGDTEPYMLFTKMEGRQQTLTALFAACLEQLDIYVSIREHSDSIWLVEWMVFEEEYYKILELTSNDAWPYPAIAWFVDEFASYRTPDATCTVSLYLPVHSKGCENSCPEGESDIPQFLISGIGATWK